MTCHKARCWWRVCPGCGRERRLAPDGQVMRQHNRWKPTVRAMVPCEGSGQEPSSDDLATSAAAGLTLPGVVPVSGSAQPSRPARRGAA